VGAPQCRHCPGNDAIAGQDMKFLIVGLGGIGQRHTRNLRALHGDRCELIAYRVRRDSPVLTDSLQVDAPTGLEERYGIRSFDSLDAALGERPDAVLICNPSSLHVSVALAAARAGCHLLIEKPLSDSLDRLDELARVVADKSLVCMVAYQLRFHPCLALARRLLTAGSIGRPVACRAAVGEYLPGWHRYEDYRTMYASRRDLGGGVVLSQIHELDVLFWFFGRPRRIVSMGGHLSDLEIDVEDVASTLFDYDGMVAHLHQDYLQQPPTRQFEIIGTGGRIAVDLRALTVRGFGSSGDLLTDACFDGLERNTLFLDEMKCFVSALQNGTPVPADLSAGRQSLEMALAIRRSMETHGPVDMSASP
jgi:predicted dehydrogenase